MCGYVKKQLGVGKALTLILVVPYFFYIAFLSMCPEQRKRPKLRLRGDFVPSVDIMLTTCGEPVDMIMDTVRATCYIDYPTDRLRIVVCDDGADKAVEAAVKQLALEHNQLYYYARPKRPIHHYKAGNLQAGIETSEKLPGGPGEYLATLDADMIPDPEWLRALLPHLLQDEMLALVAPPQVLRLHTLISQSLTL